MGADLPGVRNTVLARRGDKRKAEAWKGSGVTMKELSQSGSRRGDPGEVEGEGEIWTEHRE